MGLCNKEGWQRPGLHQEGHYQQFDRGNPSPLVSTSGDTSEVQRPVRGYPKQGRPGCPGESLVKRLEDS